MTGRYWLQLSPRFSDEISRQLRGGEFLPAAGYLTPLTITYHSTVIKITLDTWIGGDRVTQSSSPNLLL